MKKLFRYTITVIRILFYCIAVAFIISYIMGLRFYIVTTGSMTPTIPIGSICIVNQNKSFYDIQAGDIISFWIGDDMLVTHRAVKIDVDGVITKGDANNTEDSAKVTEYNYVGETVWSIPKIGYAVTFLKSRPGFIMIIALFVLFLIPSLSSRTKEKHHPK